MAVTAPTDVALWVPEVVSSSIYDTMLENDRPLGALATTYDDLEGKPGESFLIPTLDATTPADNLAVTTPAVDDKLTGAGVEVTIKEAVKSIAFYDRTRYATGTDFNALAGQRVGNALNDRIELDLGAALYAGRNTAADGTAPALTLAVIGAMKAKIPAAMRRRGLVLLGESDVLEQLMEDETIANAAAFGSDEAIREGAFTRPLRGVTPIAVDEGTLPVHATFPGVALMVRGTLVKAFQKQPSNETERDARARLTRVVGTTLHAEGVVDSRGVVYYGIGA
jgi:hypothetical protein